MLEKMEVRTDQGASLDLSLMDISNGYVLSDIDGLDPVKATIISSSFSTRDGEQYQSSRREKRNIIATIDFEPDYVTQTVESLRDNLSKYFRPKSRVRLRFFSDTKPTLEIYGRVESFDSPRFTAEPKATISIINHNPDFVGLDTIIFNGNTTSGLTESTLEYTGTVETGFLFTLNLDRTLSEFIIYHRTEDGSVGLIEFSSPTELVSGDVLEISTVPGSKFARKTSGGTTSSLLYGISPQSNWLSLYPGNNFFRVYAEGAAVPYTLEYTRKYGEV